MTEGRDTTTVLCDNALKQAALSRGISLSKTLEEGLRIKLDTKNTIAELKQENLIYLTKMTYNNSRIEELEEKAEEKGKETAKANFKDKILELKAKKKRMLEGTLPGPTFNKMIKAVAAYFNLTVEEVLTEVEKGSFSLALTEEQEETINLD